MPKKDKSVFTPSPIDEPSIGFAKLVGPPVWWYSAFAVLVILFFIIILLSFFRFWLRESSTETSLKKISNTPKPTNAPYRQDSFLSPLPYDNFNITITQGGLVKSDNMRVLKLNDLLLIFNQDTVDHRITIQSKQYVLSPNEMYAYKVSSTSIISLLLELTNAQNKVFSFVVQ